MFADARSLKTIFQTALEKDTAADRAAYLEEACAGNRDLRQRVDSLLRLHDQPDRLLDQPAAQHLNGAEESLDFLEPTTRPDALGQLGHLTVLDVVGRGGMGVVLRAFDEKLHRVVAIKALAPLLASSGSARQRFVREARAAAAVTHEHVIGIYAVEDGGPVPYLVMQFVAGKTLQEKLDQSGPLPLPETLRIGLQIAEGLAAAHRQGIVHRDIKPANILLENGVERVKITDFGLARTMDDASVTRSGIVAGTPAYMSPEQAGGERIDQRSDLFSLGSVLYALCAGHPPFRAESAMAVLRRVCDDTPRPLREVNPAVPEWLAALVAKLQAKKPADRFATAAEVGTLLSRHLAQLQSGNESSDDVGPTEQMEIPARPGRRGVRYGAALVLVLVALAAWFVATHWPDGREGSPDAPVLPAEPLALKPAKTLTGHNGGVLVVAFSPNGKLLASAGEDRTILLWDTDTWKSRRLPTEHPGDLSGLAFAPDGTTLASVASTGDSCCVRLWNVATGKQEATIGGTHAGLSGVVWSADGTRLAAGGWDGTLRVWDAATRAERFSVSNVCTPFVRGLAFSPKGSERIVTGGSGPTRLWNAQTGDEIVTEPLPEMCPTFLPNSDIVGWVHRAGRVVICEASSGKVRVAWPAHRGLIEGLAVAPDGRFVVSFDPEGTARLWYIAGSEPTEVATLTGHRGSIYAAAFAPDGKRLATAGKGDFTVRLWELPPLCHVRKP